MKFLAVFTALFAVALGSQGLWTLQQLSDAIENPATDPALLPYLEQALNEMMLALVSGQQVESIAVAAPAGLVPAPAPAVDVTHWTLQEVDAALSNPATPAALKPYLEAALNQLVSALMSGVQMESTVIITPAGLIPAEGVISPAPAVVGAAPATEVNEWSLQEISAALADPTTNPALVPYLEVALNEIMHALMSGNQLEAVIIATPAGLVPEVAPAPVIVPSPMPVIPSPVEAPAVAASSSPLVQIILNINQKQEATPVAPVTPGAAAEIAPTPVQVVDQAIDNAQVPVSPVIIAPSPVQVVDNSPVSPIQVVDNIPVSPVVVVNPEFNPVDAIHVVPEPVVVSPAIVAPEFNPVDAIHVVPEPIVVSPAIVAPEVNPVDAIHVIPAVVPAPAVVGPIV